MFDEGLFLMRAQKNILICNNVVDSSQQAPLADSIPALEPIMIWAFKL